jgi:hypothetical protein
MDDVERLRLASAPWRLPLCSWENRRRSWDVLLQARQPALSQDEGILRSGLELSTGVPSQRARPHFVDADEWFIAHSRLGVSSESAATINFVN